MIVPRAVVAPRGGQRHRRQDGFITQNALFSRLIDGSTRERICDKLAEKVNDLIAEKAPYARARDREAQIIDSVVELCASLPGNNLGWLLKAINIEQIAVDKINDLDAARLETTIFGIMKRELKAVVYLGALPGFLMIFINFCCRTGGDAL